MFSERTLLKFSENLSLHYYLKGEKLFKTGDEATVLFVVHTGHVSRKVVVEIEKINKIPTQKFERIVRILNKSYSHRIEFGKEDLIGVSELIDNASMRK
jgi:CRP-like cAMP-binding protein